MFKLFCSIYQSYKKVHFNSKKKKCFNFPALWSSRSSGCHFHCFAVECSFALGSSHYTLFSYYCRPRRIDCAQQLYQKGSHTNQIRLTGSVALGWVLQKITFLLILFIYHAYLFWLKIYHKRHLINNQLSIKIIVYFRQLKIANFTESCSHMPVKFPPTGRTFYKACAFRCKLWREIESELFMSLVKGPPTHQYGWGHPARWIDVPCWWRWYDFPDTFFCFGRLNFISNHPGVIWCTLIMQLLFPDGFAAVCSFFLCVPSNEPKAFNLRPFRRWWFNLSERAQKKKACSTRINMRIIKFSSGASGGAFRAQRFWYCFDFECHFFFNLILCFIGFAHPVLRGRNSVRLTGAFDNANGIHLAYCAVFKWLWKYNCAVKYCN